MLHIPHLGTAPRRWRESSVNPVTARTALTLLEHGLLPAQSKATLPKLIEQALHDWLDRHAGMLHIGIRVDYTEHSVMRSDRPIKPAGITLGTALPRPLMVGKRLGSLQRHCPGLGETVLWHLDRSLEGNVEIFTPSCALSAASWVHWGGDYDESQAVAECEAEDIPFEGLTRKQFDQALPRWATQPQQRIKPAALGRLAQDRRNLTGRVAAALLALHNLGGKFDRGDDGMPYWPPAQVLTWGPKDRTTIRLVDDIGNDYFQSGEHTEHFASYDFGQPHENADGFEHFLRSTEKILHTLRAADHLLQLIGERSPEFQG